MPKQNATSGGTRAGLTFGSKSCFAMCFTPIAVCVVSFGPRIDVVDCTSMDANVNGMRHRAWEQDLRRFIRVQLKTVE